MRTKDDNKKDRIFAATLALIAEKPLGALTIAAIAREAKIASGTVYLYFSGKEDLLNALYQSLKSRSEAHTREIDDQLPIREQLALLWNHTIRYRLEHPRELQFLEQFATSKLITDESVATGSRFVNRVIGILEEGKRTGAIKPVPTPMLLSLLSGFAVAYANSCAGEVPGPEELEQSFELSWAAIGAL